MGVPRRLPFLLRSPLVAGSIAWYALAIIDALSPCDDSSRTFVSLFHGFGSDGYVRKYNDRFVLIL